MQQIALLPYMVYRNQVIVISISMNLFCYLCNMYSNECNKMFITITTAVILFAKSCRTYGIWGQK